MKCALGTVITVLLVTLGTGMALADAPAIANGSEPRDGSQLLQFEEVWHRGHEDDDLIFGSVITVEVGPDESLYALDTQLAQVHVFDAAGELLRTLSREGEGPGETRRPEDLVFFADGSLGLVQYINGRIIRIDLDGTPLDSMMPPGYNAQAGGAISSIRRARYRAGTLAVNGTRVSPTDDGMMRTQYLVRCDTDGQVLSEYAARSTASQLIRDGWIEKDNYFCSHERWDIDEQGRVIAADERNEYRLSVWNGDGSLAFTFGREAKPWRRTEAQKQEIRDAVTVLRDGERVEVKVEVEDDEPAVRELRCMPDGEIWVLPARGAREQEPGILATWDIFDAEGVFIRQVALACQGDLEEDKLVFLEGRRAALIRGQVQARRNTYGGSRGEEKEVAMHDVKVFAY